ncbi:MAG: PP2C family protein-serine/threonine phosphatase [Rubricoccaceae bacterium]
MRRAGQALLATRPRRLALWALVAVLAGSIGVAYGAFALVQAPPDWATRLLLDLAAVGALALAYVLLAPALARTRGTPARAFWIPLVVGAGLLVAELALATLDDGRLVPTTQLPDRPTSVLVAVLTTVGQGAFAAVLALSLRPLVLYRRRRVALLLWRTAIGLSVLAALLFSLTPLTEPPPGVAVAASVAAVLAALGCVFRQGWIVALPARERVVAGALALALAACALGLLFVGGDGPARLDVVDEGGRVAERVPYGFLISRPLGVLFTNAAVFGVLYALTALLVLLFQLPAAEGLARRAGERRALSALAALAGRVLAPAELAEAIAGGPVEAGLADVAWLALADARRGSLRPTVVAACGLSPARAEALADAPALAQAARSGALLLRQAPADHRVHARPGTGIGSLAVLPLAAGGQPLGALFAARREADAFEPDDAAALEAFAAQAALALSHAQLFSDALERDRLARELQLAREVQQRLLPARLPRIPGLDVAAAERPAAEVGGDYYDALRLGDDCLGVIVADVSGKGAAAAFYMAQMKGIFQAASGLTRAPAAFLARANAALRASLPRGAFVSALYAVVDGAAGTLTLARAGHCPALLARADGVRTLRPPGLALGLDAGPLFERTLGEEQLALAPGDVLVLYTDGLTEARHTGPQSDDRQSDDRQSDDRQSDDRQSDDRQSDGEEFGHERLARTLAAHRHLPADALRDALLDAHYAFAGHDAPADDVTLVVLRWDGPEGTSPTA